MKYYKYIKIKDTCGETYEYENCMVSRCLGKIFISYPVPLGIINKTFNERNIIFIDCLVEDKKGEN